MTRKRVWGVSGAALLAFLGAITVAGLAYAQEAAAPTQEQEQQAQEGRTEFVEEVVVTAQKRTEDVQEVPVAITAVLGQDLQHQHGPLVRDPTDDVVDQGLHARIGDSPGFRMSNSSGKNGRHIQIFRRGKYGAFRCLLSIREHELYLPSHPRERTPFMNITGNTILITGGGTGIGRALAEALHARGNHIVITGRREAVLKETAAANPGMAWAVLDVDDAGAIRAFCKQVTKDHPGVNGVILNAGIMQAEDLTADPLDLATAEAMIATNLLGPIRLTAGLLPHLKAQPSAFVMTVTSGLAFIPLTATPTYNATKAAMHSWSISLRHQLRHTSVEVLELAPPAVATDLMPGHAESPNSMPLADYIAEVMDLIERGDTPRGEILVERVKPLRHAETSGNWDTVFAALNGR